jgi:demethylmenaquinone methyltransferase/2-methoxy-6-polyprenyl-1,4-benzoquinol methylase
MLDVARRKATDRSDDDAPIDWELADLQSLPFDSNSFDRATIGFGIRNVDDPVSALRELDRVLTPNGRLVILEFGQPDGLFGSLFDVYSQHVIPWVGGLVAGDREAYAYLHESSSSFPCGESFADIIRTSTDFRNVQSRPLTGGIAYLYTAELRSSPTSSQ